MKNNVAGDIGFPWNDDEPVINQFKEDNYYVVDTGVANGKALIFFSGNGLYYPNTPEVFEEIVINNNRYEFENIGKDKVILRSFEKIVFVRDIFKQWYMKGISEKYDTIEKTVELLQRLLMGYEVVTCGVSAGGYMASVAGMLLQAKLIFSISGQWKLRENELYINSESREEFLRKYLNINRQWIWENRNRIFYFYPAGSEIDLEQYEYVKECLTNVIAVDTDVHGALLRTETFPHLLASDYNKVADVCKKYQERRTGAETIFNDIVPANYKIIYRAKHLMEMILSFILER